MRHLLLPVLLASAAPALAAAQSSGASAPIRIEHGLRPGVRILGQPDTAYELGERMRHYHVPGVSIAVISDHSVVWAKGFGVREFGGAARVDTSTLFQAGSLSKAITATAALALADRRVLSLDEDVNAGLRGWRVERAGGAPAEGVTLRRLLSHSAGINVTSFPGYPGDAPLPSLLQILRGEKPAQNAAIRADTTPGSLFRYSGGGYMAAQALMSDRTSRPFAALAERHVFRPLSMRHSTFTQPISRAPGANLAVGHERRDTPVPGGGLAYPELAAAGLWSTPSELARWAAGISRAYTGRRGGVIAPGTAREMLRPQVALPAALANPFSQSWGLGVALADTGAAIRFTHIGRNEGFLMFLLMYPARGKGIVVMTNGTSFPLINEIVRAFDAELGLATLPREERRIAPLAPAALDAFAGRYLRVQGADSTTYAVERTGASLSLKSSKGLARVLHPQSVNGFFDAESGAGFSFQRDDGGRVRALLVPTPRGAEPAVRLP